MSLLRYAACVLFVGSLFVAGCNNETSPAPEDRSTGTTNSTSPTTPTSPTSPSRPNSTSPQGTQPQPQR